jgi:hypothetical protein
MKIQPWNTPTTDKLAAASKTPDLKVLLKEYNESLYNGSSLDRLAACDDIRYCRWYGQTDDGKKHSDARQDGKPAMPWEGASDVRVRLVDRTINDISALLITAFQRSQLRVSGVTLDDGGPATGSSTLMRWILENRQSRELYSEAYLGAQYALSYGWTVYHITWDQESAIRRQKVTMDDLMAIQEQYKEQAPDSVLANISEMIQSGSNDDYLASNLSQLLNNASVSKCKKMVVALRERGEAEIEEPYIIKNMPCVTALKPYDEITFPQETTDLQRARVIYRRTFLTEVELRSMGVNDGWDKDFIEAAAAQLGKASMYNDPSLTPVTNVLSTNVWRGKNMIEIVYAYARQIGPEGIPAIYFTVFSPQVGNELYAKHEILDYYHGKYPFVGYAREVTRRPIMESRGVPEISRTDQDEIKAQHDSLRDRTALETLPPIKVAKRIGALNRIGPAVQLPVTTKDDYTFLDPPAGNPQIAFSMIERVEAQHAAYYGLTSKYVEDVRSQLLQQSVVNGWLHCWTEIYQQVFTLALQYLTPEEKMRICGMDLPARATEIQGGFDFIVKFDVREVDTNLVMEKLDAISKFAVPMDSSGVIDRNKLVKAILETISPDAAKDLIVESEQASQKMFRDVQTDIGLMLLGNAPQLVENDPSAQNKLQLAQQILSQNPKAQQALQGDENFQQLFQQYVQNLQMSLQQEQNKQVGRTGVAPQGPSMSDQVKGVIEQAKAANSAKANGQQGARDAVGDQAVAGQQQMAQEQAQSSAQGGEMAKMVMELMDQGATEEQAIQMIQQQMQGGQQGGPPQGGPQQPPMPPEGMPQ